jgi:nucleotide-binding universal stress UspA family protein
MLVATDFSEPSLAALRYAMALTYAVRGEGLLLHVVEGEPVRRYAVGRRPEAHSYWLDLMANALRPQVPAQVIHHDRCEEAQWKLSALLPPGWNDRFRTVVVVGKAADEIVKVARDRKVNLIVMGGRSRRGITGLYCRSVAGQVARRVALPVMTVWTTGHILSDQLWVSEGMLEGGASEQRTGGLMRSKASKAKPKIVSFGD